MGKKVKKETFLREFLWHQLSSQQMSAIPTNLYKALKREAEVKNRES